MGTQIITSNGGGATGTISVEEGNTAVTTVTVSESIAFTYSIIGGTNSSLFSIDSSTGALAFNSASTPGVYNVIVRATDPDNGGTVDQSVNVTVTAAPPGGGEEFFGSGMGSSILSNVRIYNGAGVASNQAVEACTGFIAKGNTITAIRQHIIWRPTEPNNYSKGNGGTWKVEIQGHDATNNRPNGVVLAETYEYVANTNVITSNTQAQSLYPGSSFPAGSGTPRTKFPLYELTSTFNCTPGTKYWLVTKQVRGGSDHYVSIDHLRNRHQFIRPQVDPNYDGTVESRVLINDGAGNWIDKSASASFGYVAIYEIVGDVGYGQAYYGTPHTGDIPYSDVSGELSTSKRIRQAITFDAQTTLTQLSIAAGKNSGSANMSCAIKQGGSTLHTATLSGFPSLTTSGQTITTIHNECGWVTVSLPDIVVSAGTPVYFELYTTSGTVYKIPLCKDGVGFYFGSGTLDSGAAYYSENSGSSWTQAGNTDIGIALIGTT